MYQLKFTKLPREIKSLKIIPLKTWITLPEAQAVYEEVQALEAECSGNFTAIIMNKETRQEVQFILPYEEDMSLPSLISKDIFNEIRQTADPKLREELELLENEIIFSFSETATETEQRVQMNDSRIDKIKKKLFYKKFAYKAATTVLPDEESSDFAVDSALFPEDVMEKIEDTPVYEEVNFEDPVQQSQETVKKEQVPTEDVAEKISHALPTLIETTKDLNLAQYIDISENDQFIALTKVITRLERCVEQGSSYFLQQLNLIDAHEYIDLQKKKYIEDTYTVTFFENLLAELKETQANLMNEAVFELTKEYEKQTKQRIVKDSDREFRILKDEVEKKYRLQVEKELNQLKLAYEKNITQLSTTQKQEKQQLAEKHRGEKANLDDAYSASKKEKKERYQRLSSNEFQHTFEKVKKELSLKNKYSITAALELFKIRRNEDLRKAVTESINLVRQQEAHYIELLKKKLQNEQAIFEKNYACYQKEQKNLKKEAKQREEFALKERSLELEEKKIALEKKHSKEIDDTSAHFNKQSQEILFQQQNQLIEMMKYVESQKLVDNDTNKHREQFSVDKAMPTWIRWTVVGTVLVGIGGGVSGIYTIRNVQTFQEETYQYLDSQTNKLSKQLSEIKRTEGSTGKRALLETFDDYLMAEEYHKAMVEYPEKQTEIIDYLIIRENKEQLAEFLAAYPTENKQLLLKVAILEENREDILILYRELEDLAKSTLTAEQKRQVALVFHEEGFFEEASLILEE